MGKAFHSFKSFTAIAYVSHLSPKQAAQALGVSESSVKRWCDQGAVPVLRTAGGHRRIPQQSLQKLFALAGGPDLDTLGAEAGLGAGAAAGLETTEFESFETLPQRVEAFRLSLERGQAHRCRQLLSGLIDTGYARYAAADALITDAMHQFGHLWEQGELAVYQERRACGICLGLLHELRQSVSVPNTGPVAIGGSLGGDWYQLPSQLVELALSEIGWQAVSLGCNLPFGTIAEAVREYRPRLLWISLSAVQDEDALVNDFNAMADSLGPETTLLIGGRAASDSLRPRLRYTAHCDCLEHMCELATALRR